jgi:hypothetical protein
MGVNNKESASSACPQTDLLLRPGYDARCADVNFSSSPTRTCQADFL